MYYLTYRKPFKCSYKSDMHNVSTHTVAGSTLPLVRLNKDEEANHYNPFEHRAVAHPTT